jgi:multiple sugar transport system permease protein
VYAAVNSTRQRILTIPYHQPFVGLKNYEQVISSDTFDVAVRNTLVFALLTVPTVTALGLGVALLLNQRVRGFGVLVALVLLPWSIPLVSAGIMWRLLLHGNFGSLNGLLLQLGIVDSYIPWLSDPDLAMGAVAMAHVWREFPLPTILFLAGLQTITPEILEAARLDRATAWQRFRYVTLPMLMPTVIVAILLRGIDAIKTFDILYATKGKGGGSYHEVETLNVYAYGLSFDYNEYGIASAVLIIFFLIIVGSMWALTARGKERY